MLQLQAVILLIKKMARLPPLNTLRVFYIASQTKSFTKAAGKLHVTQGAVSRQIKALEDSLGFPLFVRQHHELVLTQSGEHLAQMVSQAFKILEDGLSQMRPSLTRQKLLVNVPTTFASRWLAPRLRLFQEQYPHLDLSITTDLVSSHIQAQRYDCCLIFSNSPWPYGESELLHLERHAVVASPNLWTEKNHLQINDFTLLHLLNNDGSLLPIWRQWFANSQNSQNFNQAGITFSTLDQAINAAVAGAGIALVDRIMIENELLNKQLVQVDIREMRGPYGYWLISPEKKKTENQYSQNAAMQLRDWLILSLKD